MSLKSATRAYLQDAATAFNRAPAEIALFVFTAVLLSYALEVRAPFETWVQLAIGAFIVFAFAWTGTLLHALQGISARQRWLLTGIGAVAAAAYLLLIPDLHKEAEAWRALLIFAGALLLALAAPAWIGSPADASLRLRRINARILLRAIGIALYGLALFGGLALALAAIQNLFELKLDGQIYGHVFGWIMLVLVPWVVVGGLDDFIRPLDEVSAIERVGFRLISFLVPPLIVLYYLILFLYAVRIVVTSELPKNLVSPMVLAAGLLTALAAVVFDPRPDERNAGPRILRVAPLLFVPLVPLGLWALFVRIDDYGWTEFRLLRVIVLMILLALAVVASVQLLRRRAFTLRVIPLVLGVTAVLAAIGPWSVLSVARRDQQARLRAALREAQVDPSQPLSTDTTRRTIPSELYSRINDLGYYLQSHFGSEAVQVVDAAILAEGHASLADHLRLRPARNDTLPVFVHGSLAPNQPIRLEQGASASRFATTHPQTFPPGAEVRVIVAPGMYVKLDSLLIAAPWGRNRRPAAQLEPVAFPVIDVDGTRRGELIIFEAAVQRHRDSTRIDRLDGVLILR
jgi:hypothetical protein